MNWKGLFYHYWSSWITRSVHKKIFAHFRKHFHCTPKQTVLDVGCGTGFYAKLFQDTDYQGIDLSSDCVQYARTHGKKKIYCANASKMPFDNGSFDLLFCANVIHHLNNQTVFAMLEEANRLLRPRGQLIIYDIFRKPDQRFLLRLAHWMDLGTHVRSLSQIEKLFKNHEMFDSMNFAQFGIYDYYCTRLIKKL